MNERMRGDHEKKPGTLCGCRRALKSSHQLSIRGAEATCEAAAERLELSCLQWAAGGPSARTPPKHLRQTLMTYARACRDPSPRWEPCASTEDGLAAAVTCWTAWKHLKRRFKAPSRTINSPGGCEAWRQGYSYLTP